VIVVSLLLILGAVALLALGLVRGSNAYLIASIAASLLAAIALVVGSRQAAGERAAEEPAREPSRGRGGDREESRTPAGQSARRYDRQEPTTETPPAIRPEDDDLGESEELPRRRTAVAVQEPAIPGHGAPDADRGQSTLDEDAGDVDDEPADEPGIEHVAPADAARVAQMSNEVLVIDGRPRYHLAECAHLLGRESEPLPVHEAVELGFTPCNLCRPDSALLAEARRF
jgi:hypothetical protein